MSIYQTLKKYILFLSLFFILLASTHLVFIYLYDGSEITAEEGGTISVGIVSEPPSLNPGLFWVDTTNDYLLRFLFRGLLRYNVETKEMEGDIANCDLGKNYSEIKCFAKNDSKWSDGSPITKDDILATYDFLKNTDTNKSIKGLLENINITDQGDYIAFTAKNADVLLLDVFTFPIIKSTFIEKIKDGAFSLDDYVSSGPYMFTRIEGEDEYGAKKIVLTKNPNTASKDVFIGKYVFKFFTDSKSMLNNKDSLNIVFSPDKIDAEISPRFNKYNYVLPQYIALFLNSEKINTELRGYILSRLENEVYNELDPKSGVQVVNPVLSSGSINPNADLKKMPALMANMGFFKKSDLAKNIQTPAAPVVENPLAAQNRYFNSPSNKKIHFQSGNGDILISGSVPKNVQAVYINDYKLNGFAVGNDKFYYRAKTDLKTLKEGENKYVLSFQIAGARINQETFMLYYYNDGATLETKKAEITASLTAKNAPSAEDTAKRQQALEASSGAIAKLEDGYYYNRDFKKFTLELNYTNQSPYIEPLVTHTKAALKSIGIDVATKELDETGIKNAIEKGEKNYDMLLTGIHLGMYEYNIFPYFHSGQAKIGFNFSKMKNIGLDILLEKFKSSQLNHEAIKKMEQETLDILKKESVVKTYYSPYQSFFIDKNIKQVKTVSVIPYSSSVYDIGQNMYIKEQRIMHLEGKGISQFFSWIMNKSSLSSIFGTIK